ncbi:hypothetical protein C882_3755 [Caenispirillum salinarum AK4]|uniref:Uncharacterized protein n=1 Tax=Caenispirillum salinarum AK4 TaxID=1238182 RepID=K9H1E0_9PROT|nr:hypothetical protein [Caenispirillum salinarum]EKV31382.1 hypothetical protein C882_3755 [Caenispirillum salinarum AK4]
MFGFGKRGPASDADARKQAIERAKEACLKELRDMHEATPDAAERLHKRLKDRCGSDKSLPFDFKRALLEKARTYECNANMRETDRLLHEANRLAAEEHMTERAKKLGAARRHFSKACTLGADEDFRKAAQRAMETIMLTGGVHHKGPTKAKPADFAPKTPNRAKA